MISTALRAEWTKFRTVRGWVIGMIVAAVLIDLVGLIAAGNSSNSCGGAESGAACLPHVPTGPGGEAVVDSFYFVRQPLAAAGSITVRVTLLTGLESNGNARAVPGQPAGAGMRPGLQPWSKAGIMIAASTRPGAAYAAMMVTGGHGVRMQDDYTQDIAGRPGAVSAASPRWLRLTRSGATVTGYDSADGVHWTQVGRVRLPGLSAAIQAGLFAASPGVTKVSPFLGGQSAQGGPSVDTAVFDHVRLAGGQPGLGWAGGIIGADMSQAGQWLDSMLGFRQAGGRFTVTGSGDIAPAVAGGAGQTGFPTATIEDHLLGMFAGLIVAVVIGAMFMTAEYRRGLIRSTLAASPRRGQVLAAKAVVIGSVTFVAALAAAVVAVVVGIRISRGEGDYVLPVSGLTEARVIVGSAALLAVAAILALAIGTIVRRSAAAVTAVITGIVLTYLLGTAFVLPAGAAAWLLRVTPAAGFAIQQSLPEYAQVSAQYGPPVYFPLAPWAGFAVLCGYATVALGAAFVLLHRRDA